MQSTPHPIETRSYALLQRDLDVMFPAYRMMGPLSRAVIMRVVHSTGDPTLAEDLVLNEEELALAYAALHDGCPIITDVMMTTAGIGGTTGMSGTNRVYSAITMGGPVIGANGAEQGSAQSAAQLAGQLATQSAAAQPAAPPCSQPVEQPSDQPDKPAPTRSYRGMQAALAQVSRPPIVVIGCSPTSVFGLLDLLESGTPHGPLAPPVLTIATPVGYVDAQASKEALRTRGIPAISNRSMRGGAAIAAGALNALRYHPRHPGDEALTMPI